MVVQEVSLVVLEESYKVIHFPPLLFVLVMEAFSKIISCAKEGGHLQGFGVGTREEEILYISHLLFADDMLVFCGANPDHLCHLRMTLISFEAVSSLRINLAKSELVPMGAITSIDALASIMGCRVTNFHLTYLGLPLGTPFKSKTIWNVVAEKVEKILASWNKLYLSKGGKVTLIKSTLSSIPNYFLSFSNSN